MVTACILNPKCLVLGFGSLAKFSTKSTSDSSSYRGSIFYLCHEAEAFWELNEYFLIADADRVNNVISVIQ